MQLLYWNNLENGCHQGIIHTRQGHIHLRDVPADQVERVNALVRDFANAQDQLPPDMDAVVKHLKSTPWLCPCDFNPPHVGFTIGEARAKRPAPPRKARMPKAETQPASKQKKPRVGKSKPKAETQSEPASSA